MILALHITIALAGMLMAGLAYVAPSRAKLRATYGMVALTFISGTYLVVSMNTSLAHACVSGLAYLAVVSGALILAHRKLAYALSTNKKER